MNWSISKKKVLITVKTYPTLSDKYDELVCTAWITEDWEWIRIYPMPFRKFEEYKQYSKYSWIEIELEKNKSDPRPESFRPAFYPPEFSIVWDISTWNDYMWTERKSLILRNVYDDINMLIWDNKNDIGISLATFKPTKIIDFYYEETERNWNPEKLKKINDKSKQLNLFEETTAFKIMPKIPYKFKFHFSDINGVESKLMIEDWEIWQLYLNCLNKYKCEKLACEKVREKYMDNFSKTKDLYFFLWTSRQFNWWANNPFMIIWAFYPPFDTRSTLF